MSLFGNGMLFKGKSELAASAVMGAVLALAGEGAVLALAGEGITSSKNLQG